MNARTSGRVFGSLVSTLVTVSFLVASPLTTSPGGASSTSAEAATNCLSPFIPAPTVPLLTTAQVTAALGTTMKPDSVDTGTGPPNPNVSGCAWIGDEASANGANQLTHYPYLAVSLFRYSSPAVAQTSFKSIALNCCPNTLTGLGVTAYLAKGPHVAAQLVALTGEVVIDLTINTGDGDTYTEADGNELEAVTRQIVARVAPTCSPAITSVSALTPDDSQTITIKGTCLGVADPTSQGETPYLRVVDDNGQFDVDKWNACSTLDTGDATVTCTIKSWSNSQVVLTAFTKNAKCPSSQCTAPLLQLGDSVLFQLWNPENAKGPANVEETVELDAAVQHEASYVAGAALATKINKFQGGNWYNPSNCSNPPNCEPFYQTIKSNENSDLFALAMLSNLNKAAVLSWSSYVEHAKYGPEVLALTVSAYATGAVSPNLTLLLYDLMGTGANGFSSQSTESPLMVALAGNAAAASFFVSGLPATAIRTWSDTDQGLLFSQGCDYDTMPAGCFELMALKVVDASMMGYADFLGYAGPLKVQQLGQLMYAAERDTTGEQAVVGNYIGDWFIRAGGTPDGHNAMSVTGWTSMLTNLNGAAASPTGAFIQNITDWVNGGESIEGTIVFSVATLGAGAAMDMMIDIAAEALVDVVSDFAASAQDLSDFDSAVEVEAKLDTVAKVVENTEDLVKLAKTANSLYGTTQDVWGGPKDWQTLTANMSAGVAAESTYYLNTMTTTFHEAIARLIQERELLGPNNQVFVTTSPTVIDGIEKDAKVYTVVGGTPLTVVWSTIYSEFISTHA